MQEKHQCCCANGKEVSMPQLDEILEKYAGKKGALIPVLQQAQNVYGYLSKEVLEYIAKKLEVPTSQIYGVVTFYSQFHLNPRGKNIIRVCQGTACHVRGAKMILEKLEDVLKKYLDKNPWHIEVQVRIENLFSLALKSWLSNWKKILL